MSTSDGTVKGIKKIIDNGDDALRWNVVILSEGYQDSELATFLTDAQQFATTLSTTPPFDVLWKGINVHAVSVSSTDSGAADPVNCGTDTSGTGAAAMARSAVCSLSIRLPRFLWLQRSWAGPLE